MLNLAFVLTWIAAHVEVDAASSATSPQFARACLAEGDLTDLGEVGGFRFDGPAAIRFAARVDGREIQVRCTVESVPGADSPEQSVRPGDVEVLR